MRITELITIVIPSYNEERYIYNTLWKISRQRFVGILEVIIADGNSTDDTVQNISKASEDFKNLSISITEGGKVGYGRNQGASLVTTPYVLFMDADSILIEEDILSEAIKYLETHEIISVKQESITPQDKKSIYTYKLLDWIRKIMPITFCTGCFFLISKDKFNELRGFDETLQNSEDFWLSKQIPSSKFKILNKHIGQDNRRFLKIGYWNFIKINLLNYLNFWNINWFKKDVGYWKDYE
jgi:glycosyltransferase involved in cell wall biosynthesis